MSPTKAFSGKSYIPAGTFSRTCHRTLEHGVVAVFPIQTITLCSVVLGVALVRAVVALLLFFVLLLSRMPSSHCVAVASVLLATPTSTSRASGAFTLSPALWHVTPRTDVVGRAPCVHPSRPACREVCGHGSATESRGGGGGRRRQRLGSTAALSFAGPARPCSATRTCTRGGALLVNKLLVEPVPED